MIHTVSYGTGNWGLSIGALDLLERDQMDSLFQAGRQMRGKREASRYWTAPIPHRSCDLVIMNPPFTRSTGHEAKKIGVPVPSFAGFATTNDEQ